MFAKKKEPTDKERLREAQRDIRKSTRDVDKEVMVLQNEEKKLLIEIKQMAKTGNEAGTRMLAKRLVQLRKQKDKMTGTKNQLRGISAHMQTNNATLAITGAMQGASKAMGEMNKRMNPMEQAKLVTDFQRESAKMDMGSEMISDTLEDALDHEGLEEETDELTNQVLDELGVEELAKMSSVPGQRLQQQQGIYQGQGTSQQYEAAHRQ